VPILDLQRRLVELGRIRTGDQVAFQDAQGKTKRRPRKLETFRLTSQRQDLIEEAARLYGAADGYPRAWNDQWEVVITAANLPVMLPPGEALSQWNEMWSAGGCIRRCNGQVEMLTDKPCMCPPDPAERRLMAAKGEACKPTTRVNLILHELPGLGVWRLESGGYYAAVELAGAAEYLSMATSVGHRIPAHLRIVKRTVKRQVDGKPQTRNFTVPTIDIDVRPIDLLTGGAEVRQIAAPVERALPSGPVNRRERVPKPAHPEAEALPDQANLVRPTNPPMGEPPDIEEGEFFPAAEQPTAEASRVGPEGEIELEPMTDAMFRVFLAENEIPSSAVSAAGQQLFPGRKYGDLDDQERAVLARAIAPADQEDVA
jgi:hypothetical protein